MMSKKASSKVTSPASAADSGRSCHPYEPSDLRNLSSELRRLLVRRAIRVVRTQEDAEDVAHAAILRALTERARGNPAPRSWLGWLNTVTRHVSLDHMRRRSRTVATTRVEHLTHVDGNQHEYWRMVSDELLQEGLDTLSKPQRVAFEMHFIARLDYRTHSGSHRRPSRNCLGAHCAREIATEALPPQAPHQATDGPATSKSSAPTPLVPKSSVSIYD